MAKIRTRFAPSPTGYMHIGNLRTALYAYLIAKKDDGDFILRIEDTDQGRLVEGAVDIIYNTLKQCDLKHDEGPDVGGDYGPYVVPENCYFMMGDNRNCSNDSRFWVNKFVARDKILGKAVFRYWPLTRMGKVS